MEWVKPFYLEILHGNFIGLQGIKRKRFISRVNEARSRIDDSVIEKLLLSDDNGFNSVAEFVFVQFLKENAFAGLSEHRHRQSGTNLASRTAETKHSGNLLALASLIVVPLLSWAKGKIGRSLQSKAMMADAKQTEFCAYFAAITLGGLSLNAALGWWWAGMDD